MAIHSFFNSVINRKMLFISCFFLFNVIIYGQAKNDTISEFGKKLFLLKKNNRFELRNEKGLVDVWDDMGVVLNLKGIKYNIIKRNIEGDWKMGLFNKKECKVLIKPIYNLVKNFFSSNELVLIKDKKGFFVYSIELGIVTQNNIQDIRQLDDDFVAFCINGAYLYSNKLLKKDSIIGNCKPISSIQNENCHYLLINLNGNNILLDHHLNQNPHNNWKSLVKIEGNLLLVETDKGIGVYHLGLDLQITSLDHTPNIFELNKSRFMLFKNDHYVLYDSTGNLLLKFMAKGVAGVEDLHAFFYKDNNGINIMNKEGKILNVKAFDDYETSRAPLGKFIARIKDQKQKYIYEYVYSNFKGFKFIAGIKLIGVFNELNPKFNSEMHDVFLKNE